VHLSHEFHNVLTAGLFAFTDHLSRSACRLLPPIPYPHGGEYCAAVAIGYYLLLPPELVMPGSVMQSYATRRRNDMDLYHANIDSTTDVLEHEKKYALVSLHYVLDAIMKLFEGDERALHMLKNSRVAAYSMRLNEFLRCDNFRVFMNTMFVLIQELLQNYNIMVHRENKMSEYYAELNRKVLHGVFQMICAPRPWILLQLLQMRCQFDEHNKMMFNRGVQVVFTNLLPVPSPYRGASAWLHSVNESNVLCIEAPDDLRNAVPGTSESDVQLVLGMLVATVGSDTSIYSQTLNEFIFEGMHILSRWRP